MRLLLSIAAVAISCTLCVRADVARIDALLKSFDSDSASRWRTGTAIMAALHDEDEEYTAVVFTPTSSADTIKRRCGPTSATTSTCTTTTTAPSTMA